MPITIRLEEPSDFGFVENMTREAFWDLYKPGCDEHLVVHKLRNTPAFIKELSFVACDKDEIVGNIIYSRAKVVNEENEEFEVLCMGPISVLPSCQKQGIGSLLMHHSIEKAKQMGYKAVIIWGNPGYYHRFGFTDASNFGIQPAIGESCNAFMALELYKGSLNTISGKFHEDPVFKIEEEELEAFEKQFPYKEKHVTDTQLK
jgi:predicted N-acetyltransferase YhbS